MAEKKELRESNIELLRIVCMMIVGAHFVYYGGALSGTRGANQVLSSFLAIGGKVGFDCFIVVSAWFLVNSSFKIERFLKVWGQVLFYNVLFILPVMMKILSGGTDIGIRESFAAFFPIMGSSHGYACVYLLWYLLLPIMQILQKHCTDKQLLYMLGIMTVGLIGTHTVSVVTGFSQNVSLMSNDLLLFVYIYYLMVCVSNGLQDPI